MRFYGIEQKASMELNKRASMELNKSASMVFFFKLASYSQVKSLPKQVNEMQGLIKFTISFQMKNNFYCLFPRDSKKMPAIYLKNLTNVETN
jgi:hypothetical protein